VFGAVAGGVMVFGTPNSGSGAIDSNIAGMIVTPLVPAKGSGALVVTWTLTLPHIFLVPCRGITTISIVRFAGLGRGCEPVSPNGLGSRIAVAFVCCAIAAAPSPRMNEGCSAIAAMVTNCRG
jgi:hypothetical protein